MTIDRFPRAVRQLIQNALPRDTSAHGANTELRNTYLPTVHAKALKPDNMLVVGIRGAGKSFWWAALQSDKHRLLISKILSQEEIGLRTFVSVGFGEKPSPDDYPHTDVIAKIINKHDARLLWRSVVFWHIIQKNGNSVMPHFETWMDRIAWIHDNPEMVDRRLFEIDQELDRSGIYHLVLFDALDRTTDNWNLMCALIKGLLQVLLDFRSFKRIRPKAFVRPDHIEDPATMAFPDSSKILAEKVELDWPRRELYGLLWQYLANAKDTPNVFRDGCKELIGVNWEEVEGIYPVPKDLRRDEEIQKKIFHAITGPLMGGDKKRGFPYTWLPGHLGDGRRQVSPRSFLAALRHAAEESPKQSYDYAIHYESIKKGVQEASRFRVVEVQEDYPWVATLMEPLKGLSVPCKFMEIDHLWKENKVLEKIQDQQVKLPPAHIDEGEVGVRGDLEDLGLFQPMEDGRVNMPDIYRIGYGLGRRGGVKKLS